VAPCWCVYIALFGSRLYSKFFFDNVKMHIMYVKVKNVLREHINTETLDMDSC
jgi:hypothetical protein